MRDSSKKVTANFYALDVGGRFLVAKAPPDNKQISYAGALVALPAESRNGFIPRMEAKYPNLLGAFLPFMLDATGFRDSNGILGVLGGAAMLLLGLYLVWLYLSKVEPLWSVTLRFFLAFI